MREVFTTTDGRIYVKSDLSSWIRVTAVFTNIAEANRRLEQDGSEGVITVDGNVVFIGKVTDLGQRERPI